jgi:hypothetical protein
MSMEFEQKIYSESVDTIQQVMPDAAHALFPYVHPKFPHD